MSKDANYTDVMLEDMRDNIQLLVEVIVPMRKELSEIKEKVDEIPEIKADIKTIKAALTETNKQVQNHEHRITKLEAHAA